MHIFKANPPSRTIASKRSDSDYGNNILQMRGRQSSAEPLAYGHGVTPFDRSNPVHIRAWNTLFALGWSEQRSRERGL